MAVARHRVVSDSGNTDRPACGNVCIGVRNNVYVCDRLRRRAAVSGALLYSVLPVYPDGAGSHDATGGTRFTFGLASAMPATTHAASPVDMDTPGSTLVCRHAQLSDSFSKPMPTLGRFS